MKVTTTTTTLLLAVALVCGAVLVAGRRLRDTHSCKAAGQAPSTDLWFTQVRALPHVGHVVVARRASPSLTVVGRIGGCRGAIAVCRSWTTLMR